MPTCVGLKIKPVSFGGGLGPYELSFPIPLYKLDKNRVNRVRVSERIQINPDAFTHKIYPKCVICEQLYVPIHENDVQCFKCLISSR